MMDKKLEELMGLRPDIPQIKLRDIESLVAYDRNSRTHSPAQVELLERMMLEYGWTNCVLVDEMGIVAGHGRCMAAGNLYRRGKQIKFPNGTPIPIGMVPTIDCSGWSVAQRKAYVIADNQSAINGAGWDEDLLKLELQELDASGFDMTLTAFDEDELAELLAVDVELPPEDKDPDDIPPERDDTVSVPGDVWVCGPHKVGCLDATSAEEIDRLLLGERVDVVWTDPPYGVDLDRKNRLMDAAVGGKMAATGAIKNDKMSDSEFSEFVAGFYSVLFGIMKPGAAMYVAHSDKYAGVFRAELEKAGFKFSQMLIWYKSNHVLGMAHHLPNHEPIIYARKPGSKSRWYGGRTQKTVVEVGVGEYIQQAEDGRWMIKIGDQVLIVDGNAKLEESPSTVYREPKPSVSGLHASQKPVALIERQLKNSARPGDLVFDCFGGSGSTMIAADRLGMCARISEIDPARVDVAVRRWEDYTGRKAVHALSGIQFGATRSDLSNHEDTDASDSEDGDLF